MSRPTDPSERRVCGVPLVPVPGAYGFRSRGRELACRYFEVAEAGNFAGANVLHIKETAVILDKGVARRLAAATRRLIEIRAKRVQPARDEKIITAWNGLMIKALARAGATLGET